jgi:hypothetical protein
VSTQMEPFARMGLLAQTEPYARIEVKPQKVPFTPMPPMEPFAHIPSDSGSARGAAMVPFAPGHTCRLTLEPSLNTHVLVPLRPLQMARQCHNDVGVKEGRHAEHAQMVPFVGRRACVACGYGGICASHGIRRRGPQWWHLLKYYHQVTNLSRKWKHKRNHHPRRTRFLFL